MYYVSYKTAGNNIFVGKIKPNEDNTLPSGKPFIVYFCPDGLLVGDENYLYDEENNILHWEGLPGDENLREIIGFADNEEEAFAIAKAFKEQQ